MNIQIIQLFLKDNKLFNIYIFNIFLLILISFIENYLLIFISTICQLYFFINLKEKLLKYFLVLLFIVYQLPFYAQITLVNFMGYDHLTFGNFYTSMNISNALDVYRPVHLITSIFIMAIALLEFFPKKKSESIKQLNPSITYYLTLLLFFFNLFLFIIFFYDLYNLEATNILDTSLYKKITSVSILGQIIKKTYYINFLALSYYAYQKKIFKKINLLIFLLVFFISIIKMSRLEIYFLILLLFINIEKKHYRKFIFVGFSLIGPILWEVISELRGFMYSTIKISPFSRFFNKSFFEIYSTAVSSVLGRLSYVYEISIIYYLKLSGSIEIFNHSWKILIPRIFLKNKENFYANDYQLMLDLKLINSEYPHSNTAGLGLIGESYYILQQNFWIIGFIYGIIIYLIIILTRDFEKNLKKGFYLYFLFLFIFKDTFIGASIDFAVYFILIFLFNFLLKLSINRQ